ncbi:MAG: ComF family protein [Alphaproteobacteria bacterium]
MFDAIPFGTRFAQRFEPIGRGVLDAVLPSRCMKTGELVAGLGGLSAKAWSDIEFFAGPACDACGLSFDHPVTPGTLCASCEARPPHFDHARAVFAYDDNSRSLLTDFKYGDRTDFAPVFCRWLSRAGAELIEQADIVAPVPMHRMRLWQRRYNQAALLVHGITGNSRAIAANDLIERIRKTKPQGHLSVIARARNVRGAFSVRPKWVKRVVGQTILIVDDVFTTGATVEECARVLKKAGAARVDVLTVARVPKPRP